MINLRSIKTQLVIYLTIFLLFLSIKERQAAFLYSCLVAVIAAIAFDAFATRIKSKKFQITESPIITGLIIGFVISCDEPWWKLTAAAALAIFSKHLIRFKGKHLFNPAAFGIFLTTIIMSAQTQWLGTYVWYIIVPFGIYFAWKIRKIEIIIAYIVTALLLFSIQALVQKVILWNVFGYLSYFYIFVMVIEPKTSPITRLGKFIFGVVLALLIFILTQIGVRFDVELLSLLAMNTTVPLLNFLKKGGKA